MNDGLQDIQNPAPRDGQTNKLASTDWTTRAIDEASRGVHLGDGQIVPGGAYYREPFRITSATLIETGRWKYAGTRQVRRRSAAGSASYADDPDNYTITELWNDAEEKNLSGFTVGGVASYGNGVIKTELASGFAIKHIPVGMVVWAHLEHPVDAGALVPEWVFSMPNGISGACP